MAQRQAIDVARYRAGAAGQGAAADDERARLCGDDCRARARGGVKAAVAKTAPAPITLSRFLTDPNLAGRDFAAPSWIPWKTLCKGAFGEPLTTRETRLFRQLAGRSPPKRRVRR